MAAAALGVECGGDAIYNWLHSAMQRCVNKEP